MAVPAVRLTFDVTGNALRLAGARRLETTPFGADPVAEYHGRAGHWFEVQDAQGRPIYGRRIRDPWPTHHEVFADDGTSSWVPRKGKEPSTLDIVAPLPPGADAVVVFSSTKPGAPAQETVRVAMKDLPQ
jgi:hypothetical protein